MINVKITMVNGTEYNVRNSGTSVKEFYRNSIAPYGMGMSFMPTDRNENVLINTSNIVAIREMTNEEVEKINEPEEVVGLRETDIETEEAEESTETEQPESE